MKKLLLVCLMLLGCKNNDPQYVGQPIVKPVLDWQKGTESIQRGFYSETAALEPSLYYAMISPECDRKPALPVQIVSGARMIIYRNFPNQVDGNPAREENLSINKVLSVEFSRYGLETKAWSRNSAYFDDLYYTTNVQLSKVEVEGTGRYRADGSWSSPSDKSARGVFPKVDQSAMLEVVKEALREGSGLGHTTITQGVFHFGNGDMILAIQRLRLVKVSETESFGEIEVRLPKQPGLYDVNCIAATAYFGRVDYKDGKFLNEDETELLFTTAHVEEGK